MTTIAYSTYTSEAHGNVSCVLVGGMPVTRASDEHDFHAQYARAMFHNSRGARRLVLWNGDRQQETVLATAND